MSVKWIALGLCLLGLSACGKRLEGNMQVSTPLTIVTKSGQPVQVPVGVYHTVVSATSNSATVTLNTKSSKVAFALPAIPQLQDRWGEGRIYLYGNQIGQNFDVDLDLDVTTANSAPVSRVESCVYDTRSYQEYICRDVPSTTESCHGTGPHRSCSSHTNYHQECNYVTRTETIYGNRDVYGYYSTTRRSGSFKIVRNAKVLARLLDEKQASTNFVETSSSSCRR